MIEHHDDWWLEDGPQDTEEEIESNTHFIFWLFMAVSLVCIIIIGSAYGGKVAELNSIEDGCTAFEDGAAICSAGTFNDVIDNETCGGEDDVPMIVQQESFEYDRGDTVCVHIEEVRG